MININDIKLLELLPSSIRDDPQVIAAATALDSELQAVSADIKENIIIARIGELSEDVIDVLAWQWHLDFYDETLSLDVKRELVKKSLENHRIKGTPAAVENIVATAFKSATVREWYEYGGNPYFFKVEMVREGMPGIAVLDNLVKSINAVKNVRSWLDEISFRRDIVGKVYIGGITNIFREISIYPPRLNLPAFKHNMHIRGAQYIHKEVRINA